MSSATLDFSAFEVLSFDCYGTLIDWESGILAALRPLLSAHGLALADEETLEWFAELEPEIQRRGYARYGAILTSVVRELGGRLGFTPSASQATVLADSVKDWEPFPDAVKALGSIESAQVHVRGVCAACMDRKAKRR